MNIAKHRLSLGILVACVSIAYAQENVALKEITVTAEEQLKQSLGVSTMPETEIEKMAVVNDISDAVRKMPGVNLTSNSANGERGNGRQIDIRGMGPENTLILIDGRPVSSRQSVRYSWRGQRDTRGDSNWVPVEEIESIEVLRGPAAARYGSGAMGGVVNIKTKRTSNTLRGNVHYFVNLPEDSEEGSTHRVGFGISGPVIEDKLSFRLYGNWNKTQADALFINERSGDYVVAGREGVRNKDISALLSWNMSEQQQLDFDFSYSRQGNIYAGDSQNNNLEITSSRNVVAQELYGAETNRMYRQSYALTHKGDWQWGSTKFTAQYDRTTNSRLREGLTGGPEGRILGTDDYVDSVLKTSRLAFESSVPFQWGGAGGITHVLTVGVDYTHDSLDDPASMSQGLNDIRINIPAFNFNRYQGIDRGKQSQNSFSAFVEDNILFNEKIALVPGVRFDYNQRSGNSIGPSLSMFYYVNENITLKGGVAKAYKAPNLYQSSEGYLLYTRGNGCPLNVTQRRCFLMGNADLKPEKSWNKEIGVEYNDGDFNASILYFHNDYRDKISAGTTVLDVDSANSAALLQWENVPKAVVSGIEGNITLPLIQDKLTWTNNFTYMIESEDKSTGNPLSIIPKYTINSFLDWQINPKWDAQLNITFYGRQTPRKYGENRIERNGNTDSNTPPTVNSEAGQSVRSAYQLVGLNAGYRPNKNVEMRFGVSNLFDKKLYRYKSLGANTYNEPGRAYYARIRVAL